MSCVLQGVVVQRVVMETSVTVQVSRKQEEDFSPRLHDQPPRMDMDKEDAIQHTTCNLDATCSVRPTQVLTVLRPQRTTSAVSRTPRPRRRPHP